jgi:hypothetical protein
MRLDFAMLRLVLLALLPPATVVGSRPYSAFGGMADTAGLAAGSTRSRMTRCGHFSLTPE